MRRRRLWRNPFATGCPESVTGHDSPDANGRCAFCGQKIAPKMERPKVRLDQVGHTEIDDAYRYYFNPDWGGDRGDY